MAKKYLTDKEVEKKVNDILRRSKNYGITTESIKKYQHAVDYANENKLDVNSDSIIKNAMRELANEDDLTLMFDKRRKSNKQRLANIKNTMENENATNQDIVDYIEGINKLIDNISVLENIASEQVGELFQMSRNKNLTTNELIDIINKAKEDENDYDSFIQTTKDLINQIQIEKD